MSQPHLLRSARCLPTHASRPMTLDFIGLSAEAKRSAIGFFAPPAFLGGGPAGCSNRRMSILPDIGKRPVVQKPWPLRTRAGRRRTSTWMTLWLALCLITASKVAQGSPPEGTLRSIDAAGSQMAHGPPVLTLDRFDETWDLGHYAEFWIDEQGSSQTIEDLHARAAWQPVGAARKTYGLHRGTLWLRVRMRVARHSGERGGTGAFRVEFGHPRPIQLTAYVPRAGVMTRIDAGLDVPLAQREVRSRKVVVPFEVTAGAEELFYFRLETAPLGFSAVVTSAEESLRGELVSVWALGGYYGAAFALFLYNFFLFAVTRKIVFFWYICFLFTTIFFFAARNGLIWSWGWTPSSGWGGGAVVAVQLIATLSFAREIMGTANHTPRLDRPFRWTRWICAGALATTIIWPRQTTETALAPLAIISISLILVAAAYAAIHDNRPARIFLLAWGGYLAAALLYLLKSTGVIAHNSVTEHAMQVASVVEMSLLSIALADRMRSLEREANEHAARLQRLGYEHERAVTHLRAETSARIVAAQDEYSRRIARDLHDTVAHRFLLIDAMGQDALAQSNSIGSDSALIEEWSEVVAVAREGLQETREIAHGLYPQRLVDLGLETALSSAAAAVERMGIPVDVEIESSLSELLSEMARLTVLRVAEEALYNAVRHGNAESIRLYWVSGEGVQAELRIEDNGHGNFSPSSSTGIGLRTMADRAAQVDAVFRIEPRPGVGTRVVLSFPAKAPA